MVPDASLLSTQHNYKDSSGFSLLSNLVQQDEMDSTRNEVWRVINRSWDNLFRNKF